MIFGLLAADAQISSCRCLYTGEAFGIRPWRPSFVWLHADQRDAMIKTVCAPF
jgi:hypothetical protein